MRMRGERGALLSRDATRIFRATGDIARNYAAVVSVKSQARMPIFDLASNLASKANPPFRVIAALHRRVLNGPKRNVDEGREREGRERKSVGKLGRNRDGWSCLGLLREGGCNFTRGRNEKVDGMNLVLRRGWDLILFFRRNRSFRKEFFTNLVILE